jgi:hypothetical protein
MNWLRITSNKKKLVNIITLLVSYSFTYKQILDLISELLLKAVMVKVHCTLQLNF